MGIDKSIYIGPYARVPRERATVKATAVGCPKCKTGDAWAGAKATSPFCPKCGTETGPYERAETRDVVNVGDLRDRFKERLVPAESCTEFSATESIWLPNVSIPTVKRKYMRIGEHGDDQGYEAVDRNAPTREVAEFEKRFWDELAILEEVYGKGKVEVEWGVVITYS